MILSIYNTGSGGNFNVVEFSDEKKIIVDFGKTAKYSAYKDFCKKGYSRSDFECALITHTHNDHAGDVSELEKLGIKILQTGGKISNLEIVEIPLIHNVECRGYMVLNRATNELYAHCTDFSAIPQKSLDILTTTIRLAYSRGLKVMFACELAYCDFLFKKLPDEQKIGLENHCSLSTFCEIMNMIPKGVSVVTLHASGRDYKGDGGINASVCPKDWVINNVKKRCGRFVNFGVSKMDYQQ